MKASLFAKSVKPGAGRSWCRSGLFVVLLLAGGASWAMAPAAQTNIGNTASASFLDSAGRSTVVTSNPVVTVVQQVGAFAVDDQTGSAGPTINTKTTTPARTVYAPHILTNTGNGQDRFTISVGANGPGFSKVEVFADDGTGNPSGASLCSSASTAACALADPVAVAGSNGTYKFVVAYTVPDTATGTGTPYETATITVAPISASLPMYSVRSTVVKDAVNLTTGAAFTMNKSIAAPQGSAAGGGAWPLAAASGTASSSSSCSTVWKAGLSSSDTCKYTVYTLTFSNIGAASGRFALMDTLPAGLTYVAGSAVWSSAAGLALTDAALGDPAGIDYQYSGGKITAVVDNVAFNNQQTLSFVVLVNKNAATGTESTTNVAFYNSAEAGNVTSTVPGNNLITPTGTTPYLVQGRYGVTLGAAVSDSVSALDKTPGTPNGSSADNTVITSAVGGSMVKFEQRVYNTGDATDTINLSLNPGTFPAGTAFLLFAADGATPLYDTGVLDGVIDTGPIPPGGQASVVVAAFLPAGLPPGSVNYRAVLTGTSRADPTKLDATSDAVSSISRGLVDLTNTPGGNGISGMTGNGDSGPGPSPQPTTVNVTTPGVATAFNLYVANNEAVPRTYALAASGSPNFVGNLPANWTVKFAAGANASCEISTPTIADTGSINGGAQVAVTACVTPAPSQTPVAAVKVYFRVLATTPSETGAVPTDLKTDAVTVNASIAQRFNATLVGNNSGELNSAGSVVYSHVLTNVGLENCGAYTLQAAFTPAQVAAGWTSAIYLDADGNGQMGSADVLVTGKITTILTPGAANAQRILVRVTAPAGLSAGATSVATVSAIFDSPNSCGAPSAIDLTTINLGAVRVYKSQALDTACAGKPDTPPATDVLQVKPGGCIYYHVEAKNEGVGPVSNVSVKDRAPAYTALSTTQPPNNCRATNTTGTAPIYASVGTEVSCGSENNILNPGGSVILDYTVTVDR